MKHPAGSTPTRVRTASAFVAAVRAFRPACTVERQSLAKPRLGAGRPRRRETSAA